MQYRKRKKDLGYEPNDSEYFNSYTANERPAADIEPPQETREDAIGNREGANMRTTFAPNTYHRSQSPRTSETGAFSTYSNRYLQQPQSTPPPPRYPDSRTRNFDTRGNDSRGNDNRGNYAPRDNRGFDNRGNDNRGNYAPRDNRGFDNRNYDNRGNDNRGNYAPRDNRGFDNRGNDNRGNYAPRDNRGFDNRGGDARNYPPRDNRGFDNRGNDNRGNYVPRDNRSGEGRNYPPRDNRGSEGRNYPPRDNRGFDSRGGEGRNYPPRDNRGFDNRGGEGRNYPPREGRSGEGRHYPPRDGRSGEGRHYPPRDGRGFDNRGGSSRSGEGRSYPPRDNRGFDNRGGDRGSRNFRDNRGSGGFRDNRGGARSGDSRKRSLSVRPHGQQQGRSKKKNEHVISLARALATLQFCSRNIAIEYIQNARVRLNGTMTNDPNTRFTVMQDRIMVDELPLTKQREHSYILVHKNQRLIPSKESNKRTIHSIVPSSEQWYFPAGRLDKSMSGLVLMTNDAAHKNESLCPLATIEKEYWIKVQRTPKAKEIKAAEKALNTTKGEASMSIHQENKRSTWVTITVKKSTPTMIRKALKAQGLEVLGMHRYRIGSLTSDTLTPGSWKALNDYELDLLRMTENPSGSFFFGGAPAGTHDEQPAVESETPTEQQSAE